VSQSRPLDATVTATGRQAVTGLVFDIKKFALHDGPGIRTTVFLKGCPAACRWCHNPESLRPYPEVVFFASKCIGCGRCAAACPAGAVRFDGSGRRYDRDACRLCGACAEACYAEATVIQGRRVTVAEVIEEVEKDRPFYDNSGGGMTVSGGEPMYQPVFTQALLEEAKARGVNTVLDTAGLTPWPALERALAWVDLLFYDLKHMDAAQHERLTGVRNDQALENARRVMARQTPWVVRVPVVPTCNDTEENFAAMADFLRPAGASLRYVEFLPYHGLGEGKWERLGMAYSLAGLQAPTRERLERLATPLRAAGIEVRLGT
jgi:pyruvate formate lyase activating enzyme